MDWTERGRQVEDQKLKHLGADKSHQVVISKNWYDDKADSPRDLKALGSFLITLPAGMTLAQFYLSRYNAVLIMISVPLLRSSSPASPPSAT